MAESRRPKTLILDLYGRYSPQVQGWIAVGDLVHLMGLLGVDEQAVRSAVSRMTRRGLLHPDLRSKVRGYATTPEADALLADGDRRIYVSMEPAALADGWVLLSFSMPEQQRDKRHVLRSNLMWLGLGNVSSGLWIGPRRLLPEVRSTISRLHFEQYVDVFTADYDGCGDAAALARRSWDLDRLAAEYSLFIEEHKPQLASLQRGRQENSGEQAFVTYTLTLHHWRKFPYLDPGLPAELLPRKWPGRVAAELFADIRERLEPGAFDYVATTVGGP